MFSALSIPIWSVSPESPHTDSPHGRPRFVLNAKLFGSIGFRRSDVNTRGAKRAGNLREEIGEEIGEDRLKSRRNGLTFFSSLLANLNWVTTEFSPRSARPSTKCSARALPRIPSANFFLADAFYRLAWCRDERNRVSSMPNTERSYSAPLKESFVRLYFFSPPTPLLKASSLFTIVPHPAGCFPSSSRWIVIRLRATSQTSVTCDSWVAAALFEVWPSFQKQNQTISNMFPDIKRLEIQQLRSSYSQAWSNVEQWVILKTTFCWRRKSSVIR